jgi:hypothetical protein
MAVYIFTYILLNLYVFVNMFYKEIYPNLVSPRFSGLFFPPPGPAFSGNKGAP